MPETFVLAIDLGTSGPKVALVSSEGRVVDWVFEKTRLILLPNGGAEQDPRDWWDAIRKVTRILLERNRDAASNIVAVSTTAQWSGTVAVGKNGKPLMNAVIWMDSRGAPHIQEVVGGAITIQGYGVTKLPLWLRLTGGIPSHSGKDPIAHILYIKHAFPEVYRETYKFLEPKDYINFCLTGEFYASFDSIALHWVTDNRAISNVKYDDRLLRRVAIDPAKLPFLKRAVDIIGTVTPKVAHDLGIPQGVFVIAGTPDIHSASIGSGAIEDYQAYLYIGTSSWLTCHVPFKKVDLRNNMTTLPSAIPGKYFVANAQECAGACLDFLAKILFESDNLQELGDDIYQLLNSLAERSPAGSNGVIFTPWLYGERTPVEDATVRGSFSNISLKTSREHLTRAVFEGVAYNSRWLLECVERFIGRSFEVINISGGGAQSDVWCQIHADVFNLTVRQVKDPILANVRGAGFLALVSLGYLSFADVTQRIEYARTFVPNPERHKVYSELFREFKELYKKNRAIYARLNGRRK